MNKKYFVTYLTFFVVLLSALFFIYIFTPSITGYSFSGELSLVVGSNGTPVTPVTPSPSGPSSPGGGGGGGGGAAAAENPNFIVTPDVLATTLVQDEGRTYYLTASNTGNTKLDITINPVNLDDLVILDQKSFSLGIGEKKTIKVVLFALEKTKPDVYIGKILFKSAKVEREVSVVVNTKSKTPLFDVRVTAFPKLVLAGEKVNASILFKNIGFPEKTVDIDFNVSVFDFNRTQVLEFKKETIGIKGALSILRELYIPPDTIPGKYIVVVRMQYWDVTAGAFDTFEVVTPEAKKAAERKAIFSVLNIVMIAIILILLLLLILLIREFLKRKNILISKEAVLNVGVYNLGENHKSLVRSLNSSDHLVDTIEVSEGSLDGFVVSIEGGSINDYEIEMMNSNKENNFKYNPDLRSASVKFNKPGEDKIICSWRNKITGLGQAFVIKVDVLPKNQKKHSFS